MAGNLGNYFPSVKGFRKLIDEFRGAQGGLIREAREKAGLAQLRAAELLGVTRAAISGWERGTTTVPEERLHRLAELYGTTVAALTPEGGRPARRPAMSRVGVLTSGGRRSTSSANGQPRARSQPMRAAMHALLAELSAWLTEEDEDFIRDTFARAEESLLPHGGHAEGEASEEDLKVQANALSEGLRVWARERRKRRRG